MQCEMVCSEGFKPPTYRTATCCSIQLSYEHTKCKGNILAHHSLMFVLDFLLYNATLILYKKVGDAYAGYQSA